MMLPLTTEELVNRGMAWLRGRRCLVVVRELGSSYGAHSERCDVLGYDARDVWVLEVKTSLADFRADAEKPHRRDPALGMGTRRLYVAPARLLPRDGLPAGWGLLEPSGTGLRRIVQGDRFQRGMGAREREFRALLWYAAGFKGDRDKQAQTRYGLHRNGSLFCRHPSVVIASQHVARCESCDAAIWITERGAQSAAG